MVRPERFELPTLCFEGRCSIQLSYGRVPLLYLISWRKHQSSVRACMDIWTLANRAADGGTNLTVCRFAIVSRLRTILFRYSLLFAARKMARRFRASAQLWPHPA